MYYVKLINGEKLEIYAEIFDNGGFYSNDYEKLVIQIPYNNILWVTKDDLSSRDFKEVE
jgi:hypothetical protein